MFINKLLYLKQLLKTIIILIEILEDSYTFCNWLSAHVTCLQDGFSRAVSTGSVATVKDDLTLFFHADFTKDTVFQGGDLILQLPNDITHS